jgi:hypothetical protein
MTQAINWWFAQNYTHMFLFAQDESGKTHRCRTLWKDGEPTEQAEHRLIVMMQKKHGITTAY